MLLSSDAMLVLLLAILADAVIGDPDAVWRRWPHPVAWFGALIHKLDKILNREDDTFARRKLSGVLAVLVLVVVVGAASAMLDQALRRLPGHPWTSALVASILIAQNALYVHVARVSTAFASGGLAEARRAVSMIVGRNPESLDEAGVCRAAIETTAENFSDGVVAPVFWFAVAGLPGLAIYKAINTADSMIGHRTPRHEAFGWAAARLDDVVNLAPARLSGLLVAVASPLAGGTPHAALSTMWRDASLHKSPNAGWPEAAMAGALGLALAGPRRYSDHLVDDPFLNSAGRKDATPDDINRALKVLVGACTALALLVALLAIFCRFV
ncbi:MAG: adenosylcobinamide-phosphate synthase CbiB [Beijerinckiaceae bacterium]